MTETLVDERGITAKAGTAKARIERAALMHFKSKADLTRVLMTAIHDRLTELVRQHADQSLDAAVSDIVRDYAALADEDWALFAYHLLYMHRFPNLAEDGPLRAAADLVRFNQGAGRLPSGVAPELLASMALGVVLQAAHSKLLGANIGDLSDHIDSFERAVMAVLEDA